MAEILIPEFDLVEEEIARKPIAYIVIHRNSPELKYLTPWENVMDPYPEYDVKIIEGDETLSGHPDFFIHDNHFKAKQTQNILNLFAQGEIKNGDLFLFTDAWHPGIIQTRYAILNADLQNVRVFGFWADSFYTRNIQSDNWKKFYVDMPLLSRQGFARIFEISLIYAIDFNCVENSTVASYQQFRFYPQIDLREVFVTGLPFGFMKKSESKVDYSKKRNMILFPYHPEDEKSLMVDALKAGHQDWEIIFPANKKVTRKEYLELLDLAKVVIITKKDAANLLMLYEAMCHGCYPLMPSAVRLRHVFGTEFKFDSNPLLRAKTFLKMFRARGTLHDKIEAIFDGYHDALEFLQEKTAELDRKFYNNDIFDQLIRSNSITEVMHLEFGAERKQKHRTGMLNWKTKRNEIRRKKKETKEQNILAARQRKKELKEQQIKEQND